VDSIVLVNAKRCPQDDIEEDPFLPKEEHVRESKTRPIADCEVCADLADKAFEATKPSMMGEIATAFLDHVIKNHTGELLSLLAEKYVPIFMNKRAMR